MKGGVVIMEKKDTVRVNLTLSEELDEYTRKKADSLAIPRNAFINMCIAEKMSQELNVEAFSNIEYIRQLAETQIKK